MSRKAWFIRISLISAIVTSVLGPIAPARAKPPLTSAIFRQQDRNQYIRFESVIAALNITPGMTILDIGSGPGYASFLFAEKLHGSGKVFATDIREDFVRHIADEAKKRGLTNLVSALVKAEGLDDFYRRHRYDLVFLSNVYHCLDNRIEYFRSMRELLNPGARVVLILYNQAPLFSVADLTDLDGLADRLSKGTDDDPFHKRLSAGTRQLLGDKTTGERLARALVDDFNRTLVDPRFYKGFYADSNFRKNLFTAPERDFANWLLMTLEEDGVFERPVDRIDAKAMRAVIKLNRLFFVKLLGHYLAGGGIGAYVPAGDANRHTSKYVMLRELDAAGYRFISESGLSPFFDAVIMAPKTP